MDHRYSPELIENLNELHGLLLFEEKLDSVLQRVVQLTCATVPGCDSAGVTLIGKSRLSTAAATDEFTLKIDRDQYENREGPCLQAVSTADVVVVEDISQDPRWPTFAQQARKNGLGSALSLPLEVRNKTFGSLNLYSRSPASFSDESQIVGKVFATQAATAILNAYVYASALKVVDQLKEAMKTREVIGEAKGIVMAQEDVNEEEAFEMLKRISQNTNVKLREIAQKIVDTLKKSPPT